MMIRSALLWLLFFSICQIQAQTDSLKVEFGIVDLADLQMQAYEKDSSADALILLDKGEIGFDNESGLVYMEYHGRVKIFKKEAFYLADLTIPYTTQKEIVLEAVTHHFVDGAPKKMRVSDEDIYEDKLSDEVYTKQISFPGVVEGVILEYRYIVYGNSALEFLPWYFQSTIPVRYSEFKLNTPGAYSLKPRLYGYNELLEYDDGTNYDDAWHTLKMVDVPAFVEEPYVNKIEDHYSKVTFEYEAFFAPSWKDLNGLILNLKGFGETIDKVNQIKKFYPSDKKWMADKESVQSIHQFVSNHFKWNGEYGLSFSDKPKALWKNGTGSSADINLLLLMFLKKAGLNAQPVFFSTTDHGLVNQDFINYQQFNNLVVLVSLGEEDFLLDATSKSRPFNILPDAYLNGNGLVVGKGEPEWVSIRLNNEVAIQSVTTNYEIDIENDLISGSARVASTGALAANSRILFESLNSNEVSEYVEGIFDNKELDSVSMTGTDDAYSSLNISFNYEVDDWVEQIGPKLFLSPVIFKEMDQNPFKLEERTLPIDFTMPINNKYIFDIAIPEGYEVEEMPEPITYSLPNNDGGYTYQIEKTNDTVRVLIRFGIRKIFFTPDEYKSLREVFNLIIAKQEEKIILTQK